MATLADLRAQINSSRQAVELAKEARLQAKVEADEAEARQQLRRELEQVQSELTTHQQATRFWQSYRHNVDSDHAGPHMALRANGTSVAHGPSPLGARINKTEVLQGVLDCNAAVAKGELEWSIKGFSWLRDTLVQEGLDFAKSPEINVCDHCFTLFYHPDRNEMGDHGQRGSLVIHHLEPDRYEGVVFRYAILIKSRERGYVEWGSESVCEMGETHEQIFGPDVCDDLEDVPIGVFGMNHDQLIHSEWIIDDVLTAKLQVQVRPQVAHIENESAHDIVVPVSSLSENLLYLLESGASSDVTFVVRGDTIKAHSQILAARSEVFQRQLACGMSESASKQITIEDSEPIIFKAFLRYLYSDSFASLESYIEERAAARGSCDVSGGRAVASGTLQDLLAVSHKYQLSRLQLWCERKLSECISVENVCSVLSQAHLFEAAKLEKKCLDFIKANMNVVIETASFGSLTREWPEVGLKITMHVASVPECIALKAIEEHNTLRKRKRDD